MSSTITISRAALERWEQRLFLAQDHCDREEIKAVRGEMQARLADADAAAHSQWKCGNEFLPFHPQASHVPPDHRDGWNACYEAAMAYRAPAVPAPERIEALWSQATHAMLNEDPPEGTTIKGLHAQQRVKFAHLLLSEAGNFDFSQFRKPEPSAPAAEDATCTGSQTEPAFVPRRMRCIKAVPELMTFGGEWVEIRPNVFRPAAHPEGDVGLDFNAMGRCGCRLENYLAPVDDGCAQRPEVGAA